MSDKDQFTFDDNDDFPEADLSSAFSDGELEADNPAPDVQEEPEQTEGQKSRKADKSSGSGGSRTRILLVVLLLVVAGGAGAYYFMDLGGTAPVVPTVPVPAQKAQKTVALPPQPAKVPPAKVQPAAKPVSVAVRHHHPLSRQPGLLPKSLQACSGATGCSLQARACARCQTCRKASTGGIRQACRADGCPGTETATGCPARCAS